MEEEQNSYSQCKDFWEEAFTCVRKLSEYIFLITFTLLSFTSVSFAIENVNAVKESTSFFFNDIEDKDVPQKKVNFVRTPSFEQNQTVLADKTYYAENSEKLAFALSGSVPEKNLDRASKLDSLKIKAVQKLPSFSQESTLNSEEQKGENGNTATNVVQSQDKGNAFTATDDNSINKIQHLIDEAKEKNASAKNFIVKEEQKEIQQSTSSVPKSSERVLEKIPAITEKKNAPQTIESKISKKEKKEPASTPVRLFNTVDLFRKPIKGNAPKWERVVNLERKKKPIFGSGAKERMPANVYKRWIVLRGKIENLSDLEKAKSINRFFNQWPYKTDMELWGVEDYWEDPEEFLKKSGDCTDYAITKYYALRELGVPAEKMRIVALIDKIRGLGHAVLAFYHNDTAYILDNTTPLFLEHTKFSHYDPKYSVNEVYRWGHAKILRKVLK